MTMHYCNLENENCSCFSTEGWQWEDYRAAQRPRQDSRASAGGCECLFHPGHAFRAVPTCVLVPHMSAQCLRGLGGCDCSWFAAYTRGNLDQRYQHNIASVDSNIKGLPPKLDPSHTCSETHLQVCTCDKIISEGNHFAYDLEQGEVSLMGKKKGWIRSKLEKLQRFSQRSKSQNTIEVACAMVFVYGVIWLIMMTAEEVS